MSKKKSDKKGMETVLLNFLQEPKSDYEIRMQFGLKIFDSLNSLLQRGAIQYQSNGKYLAK